MGAAVLGRLYRFGLFSADTESGRLLREGIRVKLQDQPFRVLCLLLEPAGQVITREELRQSLWSSDTYVEFDGSLNAALKRLRFALGDSAENPIFIETLPKRGYRFVAPVAVEESVGNAWLPQGKGDETYVANDEDSTQHTAPVPRTQPARAHWRQRVLFGFALALLVAAGVASYHRLTSADGSKRVRVSQPPSVRPRVSVAVIGFNNASGRPEDAWLSTAFSEMLSTELAAGGKLGLVSGERVANLLPSSPCSPGPSFSPQPTPPTCT